MAKRNTLQEVAKSVSDSPPAKTTSRALKIDPGNLKQIKPITLAQNEVFKAYKRGDYFITLTGSAGTGKSFIATYLALDEVLDRSTPYEQLVIVRSAVQGRDIGFTPGTVEEKAAMYETPYMQIASDLFGRSDAYHRLVEQKHIQFMVTSFLRGTTFNRAIILVDEAQNMNFGELSTIITRVGHESKIIFCGDIRQDDLTYKRKDVSGFQDFLAIASKMKSHTNINFTTRDIVRSSLVKEFIEAHERHESAEASTRARNHAKRVLAETREDPDDKEDTASPRRWPGLPETVCLLQESAGNAGKVPWAVETDD